MYTMKSGYNYIKHIENSNIHGRASSSYQIPQKLWRKIWTMKTVPKLRIFMWSLCHNALSTKENLYHRRIIPDPICKLCQDQLPETTEHIFLLCPWTQDIWSHPRVKITIPTHGANRIDSWLADPIKNRDILLDLETIASILWQIWKVRNHFVFR